VRIMRSVVRATLMSGVALLVAGCSGPSLQPWHDANLSEEFTSDMANEVRTFDDYQRLEDRLFAELEKDVYDKVESGPGNALLRYSRGSAADPTDHEPNWNRSVELPADEPRGGVLLLHGLTDSPYSLRALGEALNSRGYQVLAMRMPGHGTAPAGIADASWRDWSAAAEIGMRHLAAVVEDKPIHIVGYSTGAPLALDYCLNALDGTVEPVPASLVLLSPAVGLHPAAAFAKFKLGLSVVPGLGSMEWLQIVPEFDPYKYNSFPTNAAVQVYNLTRSVARRVASRAKSGADPVLPPILVFKSSVDSTVSTNAVIDNLLTHLQPDHHEIVLFDINRYAGKAMLLVDDPGPLTTRLMSDDALPFRVTLLTNESPESRAVVVRHKEPHSLEPIWTESLGVDWPSGLISLSHLALPVPPDDPLYGRHRPPGNDAPLFLGNMALQGERGLLKLPAEWMLRLRYNPFYDYLEGRTLDWLAAAGDASAPPAALHDHQPVDR
jgi:alpha-beta hydrolase superfamily lysophospholipase